MHHLARERIGLASEKMKTRYDARAIGHDFHKGDKVWLWKPKRRKGLSPKLQTNWEGPYTVLKRLNDVVAWIQKSPHSKKTKDSVAIEVSTRPKLKGIVPGTAFLHVLRRRPTGWPGSRKRSPEFLPDVMNMIESNID
ncbi:kinectin [Trichonephila clavipes]|nr:kinectin [Trichonephila clavipes]